MSQDECERSLSQKQKQRLREPHKTRSAKRTRAAEQKREQRTHANPQKQLLSLLSSCPPHQLTQLQQTSPMEWKAQLPSAQYFSYGPCIRHYFLLAAAHTLQHHNSTIIN